MVRAPRRQRDADYAMLVKHYGKDPGIPETRYRPSICTGAEPDLGDWEPDRELVNTR